MFFWKSIEKLIFERLYYLEEANIQFMADVRDLAAAVQKLRDDVTKFTSDVQKKLAAIPTTDPVVAQGIADAIDALGQIDAVVTAADTSVG